LAPYEKTEGKFLKQRRRFCGILGGLKIRAEEKI